jgi:hypothetical protein
VFIRIYKVCVPCRDFHPTVGFYLSVHVDNRNQELIKELIKQYISIIKVNWALFNIYYILIKYF